MSCVACGGSSSPGPDDASGPDSPTRQTTTVTAFNNGKPDIGKQVVAHTNDGHVVAMSVTDTSGVAHLQLAETTTITVVQGSLLRTFIDVPPGDELAVNTNGLGTLRDISITIPTDPAPGIMSYSISVACGGGIGPGLELPGDCGDTNDVLVRADSDPGNETDVDVFLATEVPVVAGTLAVQGTFAPVTEETFAITNAQGLADSTATTSIVTAHGAMKYDFHSFDLSAGSATFTAPSLVQAGISQSVVIETSIVDPSGSITTTERITSIQPTSSSFTLDVGAAQLPVYDAPVVDVAHHAITWQPRGGSLTPDAAALRMLLARAGTMWEWEVVGPYVAGRLALPTLPAIASFDFNLKTGDSADIAALEQFKIAGGYDTVRAHVFETDSTANIPGPFALRVDPTIASQTTTTAYP